MKNMFDVNPGIVNSDVIGDLLELCNEQFVNPFVQAYAGANSECAFCGALQNDKGGADHSAADCPVVKYQEISRKHKALIAAI